MVRAGDQAADADLLEYLGSLDSTDAGWHDYLADHGVQEGEAWQRAHPASSTPVAARDNPHATTPPDKEEQPWNTFLPGCFVRHCALHDLRLSRLPGDSRPQYRT